MKILKFVLSLALAFATLSAIVIAGAAYIVDAPLEPPSKKKIVVDYGVPGDPNSTQVYIKPHEIGPGKYVYVYTDEYSSVFSYRDDSKQ